MPAPARCLISTQSFDGLGHQLHARLSCIASTASARLRGQVAYVRMPMSKVEHMPNSEAAPLLARLAGIEVDQHAFDSLSMATVSRDVRTRVFGEPQCLVRGERNKSMLWRIAEVNGEAECVPRVVYTADSCFDFFYCLPADEMEAAWARVLPAIRTAYTRAFPSPAQLYTNATFASSRGTLARHWSPPPSPPPASLARSSSSATHSKWQLPRQYTIAVHIRRGDSTAARRHMGDGFLQCGSTYCYY